jgi:peptidoglycan/LPS O-acetylase OafA/YrhL
VGLDLLRILAIALVVTQHYPTPLNYKNMIYWFHWGWSGVDLFFVLSGYLIGFQVLEPIYCGSKFSFLNFYVKRIFRIMPLYFLILSIYFTFPAVWETGTISPLIQFVSFTQNFGLDRARIGTFTHAWSLCVEEHFYCMLPIFAVLFGQLKRSNLVPLFLLSLLVFEILLRFIVWNRLADHGIVSFAAFDEFLYYPTYCHVDGLVMGLGIAFIQLFRPKLWARLSQLGNRSLIFGLIIIAIAMYLSNHFISIRTAVLGYPLFSLGWLGLVLAALSTNGILSKLGSNLSSGWIRSLALLTYAIYLSHKIVIKMAHLLLLRLGYDVFGIYGTSLTVLAILLVAFLLHEIVEKPFLKLRNQLLQLHKDLRANSFSLPLQ